LPLPNLPTQAKSPVVLPSTVGKEPPLARDLSAPVLPQQNELPAGKRIKTPGPDFTKPPALPVLARPQSDREPLTDPTLEAGTQAALTAFLPVRTRPAPFLRLNLPDPFEHSYVSRTLPSSGDEVVPISVGSRNLRP
jgi:hypothetical protein